MLTPSAFPHRYAICSFIYSLLLGLLSPSPSAAPPLSAVPISSAVPVHVTSLFYESQDTDPLTNRDIRKQLNDSLEFIRRPHDDLDTIMLRNLATTQQVLSQAVEMVTEPGEEHSHNPRAALSVALETFLTECFRMGNPQPG